MRKLSTATSLGLQKSRRRSSVGGRRQSQQSDAPASAPASSEDARRISIHGDVSLQRQTYSGARRALNELKAAEANVSSPPDGQEDASEAEPIFGAPGPRSRRSLLQQASTATRIGAGQALQDRMKLSDELARTVLAAKGMDHFEHQLHDFNLSESMRAQVGEIFQCVKDLGIRDPVPIVNQLTQLFLRQDLKDDLGDLRAELENELRALEEMSAGLQLASEMAKRRSKQRPIVDRFMSVARSLHTEVQYTKAFGTLMKTPSKRRSAVPKQQPSGGSCDTAASAEQDRKQQARWRQLRTQREIAARLRRDKPAQPHELEPDEVPTKPTAEAGIAAAGPPLQRSSSVATAASGEADEPPGDSLKLVALQPDWEDDDLDVEAPTRQEETGHEAARLPVFPAHDSDDESNPTSCSSDNRRGSDHKQNAKPSCRAFTMPLQSPSSSDFDESSEEGEEDEEEEEEDEEEENEQEEKEEEGKETKLEQKDAKDQPAMEAVTAQSRRPAKRKKQKEVEALLPKLLYPKESYMSATVNGSFSVWKRPAAPSSGFSGCFHAGRLRFPTLPSIRPPTGECRTAAIRRAVKRAQGDIELETIQLHWDSELHCAKRQVEAVPRTKLPWLLEEQRNPSVVFGSSDTSHRAVEYTPIEAVARDLGHSSRLRDGDGRGQQHYDGHSAMRPQGMFKKLVEVKEDGLSLTGFCRFHRSLRHVN